MTSISDVTSFGDIRKLRKVGGATLLYYTATTAIAVLIGLIVVNLIQPGVGIGQASSGLAEEISNRANTGFVDIIRSMISPNIINATANMQFYP